MQKKVVTLEKANAKEFSDDANQSCFFPIKMRTKRGTESFSLGGISPKLALIAVCALQLYTSSAAPHANAKPKATAKCLTPQALRAFPLALFCWCWLCSVHLVGTCFHWLVATWVLAESWLQGGLKVFGCLLCLLCPHVHRFYFLYWLCFSDILIGSGAHNCFTCA